ncbi:MAG: hypothetical protein QOF77_985 [Solirubrobacteraceae bacterium]|nr:hypothetical protein [Solirubrobacteraceae bacterium]
MKRLAATTLSLVLGWAALGAAAATSTSRSVAVTPRTVALGETLTIVFVTPRAGPARAYHVRLRAVNPGDVYSNPCLARLDFFNPKPVAAHARLRFAYRLSASQGPCLGPWRVDVQRAGLTVVPGARFTLG